MFFDNQEYPPPLNEICYSDHDHDIFNVGRCEMCNGTLTESEKDYLFRLTGPHPLGKPC